MDRWMDGWMSNSLANCQQQAAPNSCKYCHHLDNIVSILVKMDVIKII